MKRPAAKSQNAPVLEPDLCVIGAGPAGRSAASGGALLGLSVVLVLHDSSESVDGGLKAAAFVSAANKADGHPVDYALLNKHIEQVVAAQRGLWPPDRFEAMGVRVIEGPAHFTDAATLQAGHEIIRARRYVIAVGSRIAVPDVPGFAAVPFLTEDTLSTVAAGPHHLVVIGAGAEGVALAQAFRRLGAAVTLLASEERILDGEDPEIAAVVDRRLRADGIQLRLSATVSAVEGLPDGGILVRIGDIDTITASHLLVAEGRTASIGSLGLEAARIHVEGKDIVVDRRMRTSNAKVYAVGDAVGESWPGQRSAHAATQQASVAFRNVIFRLGARFDPVLVPRIVRCVPEMAAIGLTEEQARSRHPEIRILRSSFADNDLAVAEHLQSGHLKAVVTPAGKILGCSIVGPRAHDLIMPWVLAMAKNLKVSDLAGIAYPYPGYSEGSKLAAVEFVKLAAQNPWIRRMAGFIRRWG